MALQTDFEFHGINIPNTYIRIDRVEGGKNAGWSGVALVYKNQASYSNKENPISEVLLPVPPVTEETLEAAKLRYPRAMLGDALDTEPFNPDAYVTLYARLQKMYPTGIEV